MPSPTKLQVPVPKTPELGEQSLYIDHYFAPPHSLYHFHPTFELVFTKGTSGERIIGDEVTSFQARGNLLLVGPLLPHTWAPDGVVYGRIPIENIVVHFTRESLGAELLAKPELAAVRRLLHEAGLGVEFSPVALAAVRRPLEKLPGLSGVARLLAFLQILDRLATGGWSRQLASSNYNRPTLEHNHLAFSKILEYVQVHHRQAIALDAIAAHVGMSRTTFTRFFRRIRKISFTVWLNEWRIQRVAGLLRETDLPVFDIALRSGYRNLSHFNRQFHKIMKTTPTLWRRQD